MAPYRYPHTNIQNTTFTCYPISYSAHSLCFANLPSLQLNLTNGVRLIDNDSANKILPERKNASKSRKQKAIKRKLDILFDDLENSMLVEEAVADANEIINEKPLRKTRISEKPRSDRWKMLMLSFVQSVPGADHERMQLDLYLFNDLKLFWNSDVYFRNC